ncbi:NAD(P)-dependent oxidoreductase [Patescibacteria group bacterium]|nr:NAD(P)-dependent oxidoreductase [Patescibacteria group bacterium]
MEKQIIITGGLGFIGSHLLKKLIVDGYYVVVIDDCSNANVKILKSLPKLKFHLIKCDIRNKKKIEQELLKYKPKIIVHLASIHYIPDCCKHPSKTVDINIKGTQTMLEIASKINVKNFLFASSASVYKPSVIPHKEDDSLEPIDIYGQSKKQAEKIIKLYCKSNNINFTTLRLFNVYGPNDLTPHLIPSLLLRLKKSKNINVGNLKTSRDYIYVDDVVDIMVKILKNPNGFSNATYNIGTSNKTSGERLIKIIGNILDKKIIVKKNKNLTRKTDRKIMVANIDCISDEYLWKPRYTIKKGIKQLLNNSF